MPEPVKIAKAELREMKDKDTEASPKHRVVVQFNPETLKVTYANQVTPPTSPDAAKPAPASKKPSPAGAQGNPASNQFVGKGSTKLSVQLWFDVSARLPEGAAETDDVLTLTRDVAYFITSKPDAGGSGGPQGSPPLVRFLWGTFQFDGIVESLDESLELFSPEGKPLRASLTLGMTQSGIVDVYNKEGAGKGAGPGAAPAGTRPLTPAPAGATMPGLADARGLGDWQAIASANGIENPRLIAAGAMIDMNLTAPASIGVSASASASASASVSVSASASAGVGLSATGSFNL